MPWEIKENTPQCSGYGVFKEGTNELEGCHDSREKAQRQMAALYASEDVNKVSPCWEGYVQRGTKPGKDGNPVPNCVPVEKAEYEDAISKGEETYYPNSGMKSAARRALKWKEEGKATGAGTPVGWGRATDIVSGRSMSLNTVKRMYSFFSRHEVDKKGKDFYNTSNPSNGRIMWDAWGGDAGFSWSRKIVDREKAKKVWQGSAFDSNVDKRNNS